MTAERDPLIAALFDKLPAPTSPFAAEQRVAWLKLMAGAFDLTYGACDELPDFLATFGGKLGGGMTDAAVTSPRSKPTLVRAVEMARYFISADGRALRDPGGVPVSVNDVPTTETIWDERPAGMRELDTIVWMDGAWPADALPPLNIAAAGGVGGGGAASSGP